MNIYMIKLTGKPTPKRKVADGYEVERGTGILRVLFKTRVPDTDNYITREVLTAAHGKWDWIDEVDDVR